MEQVEKNTEIWDHTGIRSIVADEIRELALRCGITRVILFGSRARGDFRRESDIDLAVSGGNVDRFRLAVEEETSTLLRYDVVNMDLHMQPSLRESIEKEGIILYEKV